MIVAINPEKTAPKIPPTIVPITPISKASTNLAFLSPTIALPENQRTGVITIVDNTTLINNASKLIANFTFSLKLLVWRMFYIISLYYISDF